MIICSYKKKYLDIRLSFYFDSCSKRTAKRSSCLTGVLLLPVVCYLWWNAQNYRLESATDCAAPKNSVFMLTIPGSGADTIGNVIWRYAITHDLTAILQRPGLLGKQLKTANQKGDSFFPPYHTAVTDMKYNPSIPHRYLRVDTPYITVLRHPLFHLQSVLQNTNTGDVNSAAISVTDFLQNPNRFEKQWAKQISLTNNPYARFFGLPPDYFHNSSKVKELIATTDSDFSAVLILEQIDESLVLLRRAMCWSFKDIIYNLDYQAEAFTGVMQQENRKQEQVAKHRAWAEADYAIYEHFLHKHENLTSGKTFADELSEFKQIYVKVNNFCSHVLDKDEVLLIKSTMGNFTVSLQDCELFQASEVSLRNILEERQARSTDN